MFAHKVIEGLRSSADYDILNSKSVATCCDAIQYSQKFYFEDAQAVSDICGGSVDSDDFFDLRPPYGLSFFMFSRTSLSESCDVMGSLIIESDEGLLIIQSFYITIEGNWAPHPIYLRIDREKRKIYTVSSTLYEEAFFDDIRKERASFANVCKDLSALPAFGMKILSCKNIATDTVEPPKKLNKKRSKKGKLPLFTYKTLVLKPTGKKQESQAKQGLWDNRVHLCRGHFKTYTKEKPLFGRITGRYWWQSSVRGSAKEGVIVKDYKI